MAAKKNPLSDKAYELYKSGMKLIDIASKLQLPPGTVRRWKSTYGWDGERSETESERSDKPRVKKKAYASKSKTVSMQQDEITQEDGGLSEKQRLFCLYYVKYRNKVKAYQKAYQCSYENACRNASTLGKNKKIQKEIDRIMEEIRGDIKIDIRDLIQQQLDIARADMNDYVDISRGIVEIRGDIDGTIIKEIKNTKDGISIKLYDKQKAIDFLKNNLPDENGNEGIGNTAALAEILLSSVPNRKLEDYERKDDGQ